MCQLGVQGLGRNRTIGGATAARLYHRARLVNTGIGAPRRNGHIDPLGDVTQSRTLILFSAAGLQKAACRVHPFRATSG